MNVIKVHLPNCDPAYFLEESKGKYSFVRYPADAAHFDNDKSIRLIVFNIVVDLRVPRKYITVEQHEFSNEKAQKEKEAQNWWNRSIHALGFNRIGTRIPNSGKKEPCLFHVHSIRNCDGSGSTDSFSTLK